MKLKEKIKQEKQQIVMLKIGDQKQPRDLQFEPNKETASMHKKEKIMKDKKDQKDTVKNKKKNHK